MEDALGNTVIEHDETPEPVDEKDPQAEVDQSTLNLIRAIQGRIARDKKHFEKTFQQMREDMKVARTGRAPGVAASNYSANLAGRHVKTKTAALYAKNPKAVARRRETLDFKEWDEKPQSLQLAFETIALAQQAMAMNPGAAEVPPEQALAFQQAMAVVADYQEGMQRRSTIQKIGKTLEILFAQSLREQKPLDFKTGMKRCVRRACTTGVGYVELAFQREYGPRPGLSSELYDFRARIDHIKHLIEEAGDVDTDEEAAELAELNAAVAALETEQEVLVREGLIVDFPQSTKVIPDEMCQSIVGFVGARHITLEYLYTEDQVKELFGVDLGKDYAGYKTNGGKAEQKGVDNMVDDDDDEDAPKDVGKGNGLVCVWKHYDKVAGLVYYLADGCKKWLREPAKPDVFVEDFWPVYALTFNDIEDEGDPFPPSDVRLMLDMQSQYNASRQGMREHRKAARPRFVYPNGQVEENDVKSIVQSEAFEAVGVNLPPGSKIDDMLGTIPIPGVDMNLYDTTPLFQDIQLTVGTNESQFGGVSRKATATGEAIAANAVASFDAAAIDDLDGFLTTIARSAGQILLKEMSTEHVMRVAGVGAVWPDVSLEEIATEVFLEVEAGSTGKPNQAVEVENWSKMMPFLQQMPSIDPIWLARETIRRLDDRVDLTEAISEGAPSVMAQNRIAQMSTGDPASDPNAQGPEGAENGPQPTEEQRGSEPAFGSNQV